MSHLFIRRAAMLAAGFAVVGGAVAAGFREAAPPSVGGGLPQGTATFAPETYREERRAALSGLVIGDAAAVGGALDALIALRVPEDERDAHLALASALSAYRDALRSGNPAEVSAALDRLRGEGALTGIIR